MTFNKLPSVKIHSDEKCITGWNAIRSQISDFIGSKETVVIECYHGVAIDQFILWSKDAFPDCKILDAADAFRSEEDILKRTHSDVTDDRIFGFMTKRTLDDFLDSEKINAIRAKIDKTQGVSIVIGIGSSLIVEDPDLLIYADMARWEIQMRMRRKEVVNIGLSNQTEGFEIHYKRAYFLDWRVCDSLKKKLVGKWDYILDTNDHNNPKMISAAMFHQAMEQTVKQPFSVVPFFDPGPWGGQWMREKFDLDSEPDNFAWGFNCVPEENSLLLDFHGVTFEMPSINLVFFKTTELLGVKVEERFGAEFPIRYDFLDTIQGGNLSLQVHPLDAYIKEHFGMDYTQDESYYMLDAEPDAEVYLGLKDDIDSKSMIADLKKAQSSGAQFDADKYAAKWPAKKHDHFLIPGGTVHCSGAGSMVLEISATPYIFTFKLWDWGRLGMDGKPRPINIEHGEKVIQWDRQTEWTKTNLINNIQKVGGGDGWREERTGLHDLEFIETRRHWHSVPVTHHTEGGVNVLMIVEGDQAVVECPQNSFEPFEVNYAEAFIIPACIKSYIVRPIGLSEGKEIATLKAYVRTNE
ncbi:MAG: mannose-6-phosphate isomerase class I [Marinoscillum sp.]|jgi:mannose-6-phosphate isomerase class I